MLLFLKGFIIGIAKIIPGVSGAMLAINFNIYEKAINAVTNFFSNWKNNLKFIIVLGAGIIISIIISSKLVLYLITKYKFITLMFFIGLIIGGTYNFGINIKYTKKNITLTILCLLILTILTIVSTNNTYEIKNNMLDNFVFFGGGIIEIFSSIVPGISGTSLLMILGIYQNILELISNILNVKYVILNINLYLSYGIGMFISFIINTYLISYLLKKHKDTTYSSILGLSIASILFLIITAFKANYTIIEFIIGIMLLVIGILLSCILDK